MKEEIYERDYYELEQQEEQELSERDRNIFEILAKSGIFTSIDERLRSMPHILVPEKKEFYEKCLRLLDEMAKSFGGKIKGAVSYDKYDAQIHLTLPFFEFLSSEDFELLRLIAGQARSVCFYPEKDGRMTLIIYIDYFEALGDKAKIIDEEIKKRSDVMERLIKAHNGVPDKPLEAPEKF